MTTKNITGWLVINWKDMKHRTRQSKPDSLGTHEIATKLDVEIKIPDVDVPELAAKVQVPQPRVQTAVVESITDETFPEWSDVAEEVLADALEEGELGECDDLHDVDDLVEQLTTRVLLRHDGVVDAKNVRDYLGDQTKRVYRDQRGRA